MATKLKPLSRPNRNRPIADQPAIRPPGQVLPGGHGPQAGGPRSSTGPARLRALLNLSPTCSIDQVAEDAAAEIERLRQAKTERAARR